MCKCIKKSVITFALATILFILFLKNNIVNINFLSEKSKTHTFFKKLLISHHHPSHHQQPAKKTQKKTTTTQNPQSSIRISFQDNQYTLEQRHARLSEPLEPVVCHAPLSEPQYESIYAIYPPLQ